MDIKDIKARKAVIESQIKDLLTSFEKDAGISVEYVDLASIDTSQMQSAEPSRILSVELVIKI